MPTYRTETVDTPDAVPAGFRHLLVCEQCAQPLGNVGQPVAIIGLPARVAASLWPALDDAVRRHEAECPLRATP